MAFVRLRCRGASLLEQLVGALAREPPFDIVQIVVQSGFQLLRFHQFTLHGFDARITSAGSRTVSRAGESAFGMRTLRCCGT